MLNHVIKVIPEVNCHSLKAKLNMEKSGGFINHPFPLFSHASTEICEREGQKKLQAIFFHVLGSIKSIREQVN